MKSKRFNDLSDERAPLINTTPPGPRSKELLDYQQNHEGSAVSYPKGLPMALQKGSGATVTDVDGNIYIDFFAGAGVLNVGHGNPEVLSAAASQLENLTHALDLPSPPRQKLVEALNTILPPELNRLFFGGPTGSDAVEAAIKLARFNSRKYPVVAFEGSYHGMTGGALSLCSGSYFKEDFLPLMAEVHFVPYAYCYRCVFKKEPNHCQLECAQYFEYKIEDPHSGICQPAAVILEAIQGEGGSIVPPDTYLQEISKVCNRHGITLIVDEIQSGFCRTGRMFAFEHSGITPDIMTMSKALGGLGFPISGIAYNQRLDTLQPGKHIGTFRGNMLAYAAGAAAIKFMINHQLADYSRELGGWMLSELKNLKNEYRTIGDVRGRGLMLGVEFVSDLEKKTPAPELAAEVRSRCHRQGLLIEIGGHHFNVARFLPPLVLTKDLARKGLDIFARAVAECEAKMFG